MPTGVGSATVTGVLVDCINDCEVPGDRFIKD